MTGRLKRNYSLVELSTLATPVDEELSVAELPRFVEALAVDQLDDATVSCTLHIDADGPSKIRITGTVDAAVQTQCQRCLEGLPLSLSVPVEWHLPEDVQGDDDSLKAHEIEVRLLDWVEDDLQLSIPLFAKHADENCGGELTNKYVADDDEEHTPDTVTPFDGLKDLLSK
ncbi:MAG: DUF177 domain-containing protein [Gammaproteobacteria bacterium]